MNFRLLPFTEPFRKQKEEGVYDWYAVDNQHDLQIHHCTAWAYVKPFDWDNLEKIQSPKCKEKIPVKLKVKIKRRWVAAKI